MTMNEVWDRVRVLIDESGKLPNPSDLVDLPLSLETIRKVYSRWVNEKKITLKGGSYYLVKKEGKPIEKTIVERSAPLLEIPETPPAPKLPESKVEFKPQPLPKRKPPTKKPWFLTINLLEIFERYSMLIVSMLTSAISIYYTTIYLHTLGNVWLFAFILSASMLFFSLVGYQMVFVFLQKKRPIIATVLLTTSVITTIYSMYSSFEVNMKKYQVKIELNQNIEEIQATNQEYIVSLQESLEVKKQKKDDYKNLIEQERENPLRLNAVKILSQLSDADSQYKYYNRYKDSKTIVTESDGKIENYNSAINELDLEISELNEKIKAEREKDRDQSIQASKEKEIMLSDILGNKFGFDGSILQLIVTIFASVFIDLIAPLSLHIFGEGKKEKKTRRRK